MGTDRAVRKKVFISYVRDNSKEIDRICKAFTESNIDYWLDREHIDPGRLWKDAIKNAINNGAYFLACFSKEYERKNQTYMNEEILVAIEILRVKHYDSGWLIPIKLSECDIPPRDIGAGKTLRDLHYLDFYKDWDMEMERLLDVIKREETVSRPKKTSDFWEKVYVYRGLKALIESGTGYGFHNEDLGHPVYVLGAKGIVDKNWEYADSPKKNLLFKILSKLSKELKESGIEEYRLIWWYDFSEWKDFCSFALGVYNQKGYRRAT